MVSSRAEQAVHQRLTVPNVLTIARIGMAGLAGFLAVAARADAAILTGAAEGDSDAAAALAAALAPHGLDGAALASRTEALAARPATGEGGAPRPAGQPGAPVAHPGR